MAVTERSVNGVDVEQLEGAVEAISADPEVGQSVFRSETEWTNALESVTTVDAFDQAGETIATSEFTSRATNPSKSSASAPRQTRSSSCLPRSGRA